MGALHRHYLVGLALIAAVLILGGGQARATFIPPPGLVDRNGVVSSVPQAETEALAGMAGADETWQPQLDSDEPQAPSVVFSVLWKLPFSVRNLAPGSMSGGSSSSASGNSPSTPPAGHLPRSQVPPLELICLLPPETGAAHPVSVASFLFRPPRAA